MALGPLLYFYVRSLLFGTNKLTPRDNVHFIPLLFEAGPQVAFIFHFSGLLTIAAVRRWYLPFEHQVMDFESGNTSTVPFFISFVIYAAICFKMVNSNRRNEYLSSFKLKDINWVRTLLIVLFYIIIIWLISIVLSFLPLTQLFYTIRYCMNLLAIGFAYWLGMTAYIRQGQMSTADLLEYNKAPVKILFSDDEACKYQNRLIALVETDQLYLNPALRIDLLAEKIALSEKQISNLLNQHVGKSFNDFINEYRVQEAKKKLADVSLSQFTIASIAFDCGFNSLATFQRCFKQFTGTTPSQYQNNLKSGITSLK